MDWSVVFPPHEGAPSFTAPPAGDEALRQRIEKLAEYVKKNGPTFHVRAVPQHTRVIVCRHSATCSIRGRLGHGVRQGYSSGGLSGAPTRERRDARSL